MSVILQEGAPPLLSCAYVMRESAAAAKHELAALQAQRRKLEVLHFLTSKELRHSSAHLYLVLLTSAMLDLH